MINEENLFIYLFIFNDYVNVMKRKKINEWKSIYDKLILGRKKNIYKYLQNKTKFQQLKSLKKRN